MTAEDWETGYAKSVAVYLSGHGLPDLDMRGQQVVDDSFLLCFNAHYEPIEFVLPPKNFAGQWTPVISTAANVDDTPLRPERRSPWTPAVLVLRAERD